MSSPILEADSQHFPQPPEDVQARILSDPSPTAIGHVAMENMLAGTNSEIKAIAAMMSGDDSTSVANIAVRYRAMSDPKISPPDTKVFKDLYGGYLPFGLVDYNQDEGTVRRNPDQDVAFAFITHMLGISLKTGVSLGDMIGLHHGSFNWDGFTVINHTKRLTMVTRLGQSKQTGVRSQDLLDSVQPYTTNGTRVLTVVDGLIARKHATSKKEKQGHRRNYPSENLVEATQSLIRVLDSLHEQPETLIRQAQDISEHITQHGLVSYLHRRGLVRNGHGYSIRRQQLHDDVASFLRDCPEGASVDELYDLFGDEYANRDSFGKVVSWISRNLRNPSFSFVGHSTKGKWVYIDRSISKAEK